MTEATTAQTEESTDERLQRRAVEVTVAATAVVVWKVAADPYTAVKLTALAVGCLVILGIGAWRVLASGAISIPRSLVGGALCVFGVLGAAAVVTSDVKWASLYGVYGRGTGFLSYVMAGVVFLGVCTAVRPEHAWRVVRVVVAGGGLIALYALLQRVGADPFSWTNGYGDRAAISTLGNMNFVSGYAGVLLPLAAWLALTRRDWERWVALGITVALALTIVATQSQQGVLAGAAGLGVAAVVWLQARTSGELRRRLYAGVALVAVLGGLVVAAGLGGSGPASRLHDAGFEYRRYYWSAAVEMATDHPLSGVGFDRWGAHYREARSEAAASSALADTTDEPHSVPLAMFASGGFPLGLAYLALLAAIAWTFVRGLRRVEGERRLLLGAVGGAWVGYLIQSAVSIDVPAFPAIHLLLAGLIVVLSDALRWRTVELPGLLVTVEQGSGKRATLERVPRLSEGVALGVVLVLGVVALWQVSRPLRADMALEAAQRPGTAAEAAFANLRSAMKLNPWEAEYRSQTARAIGGQQGAEAIAERYFEAALAIDDRRFADALNAARAAKVADDDDKTVRFYRRALVLEPNSSALWVEAADAYVDAGNTDEAATLLHKAAAVQPDNYNITVLLGDIAYEDGDVDQAHDLYDQALSAQPNDFALRVKIGQSLVRRGDEERGFELIAEATKIAPTSGPMWNLVINAYERLERIPEAVAAAESAYEQTVDQNFLLRADQLRQKLVVGAVTP
jgi:Tfp pilus assembly protein PilF